MREPMSPGAETVSERRWRRTSGRIRSFEIMIDSATHSTMIIAMLADTPPSIASTASI